MIMHRIVLGQRWLSLFSAPPSSQKNVPIWFLPHFNAISGDSMRQLSCELWRPSVWPLALLLQLAGLASNYA